VDWIFINNFINIFLMNQNRLIIFFIINCFAFCQSEFNLNPIKMLINDQAIFDSSKNDSTNTKPIKLVFSQYFTINTNLPNLENHNGIYIPKGTGSVSSILASYNTKFLQLSIELPISKFKKFPVSIPEKNKQFAVLNDVLLNDEELNDNSTNYINNSLAIKYNNFALGYENISRWWGPGIHNSLILSNNSTGIPNYYFGTIGYKNLYKHLKYNFRYFVSNPMKNDLGNDFFLSAYELSLRYKNIEFGKSKHILSGGSPYINWGLRDASVVNITKKKIIYWEQINDYYFLVNFPSSKLKLFFEIGFPSEDNNDNLIYPRHESAYNLGLRKYGAFGSKNLLFGFEYTRLVQGSYYDIIPTRNWYDNKLYNYYSYNGRRWSAHSGSDSDDFLLFAGYSNQKLNLIYGINYERHGVTYHFPPEVKLESRVSFSYKLNNFFIYLNYENEYFEHYGFVDSNKNVWDETFEPGSIQYTNTLLISLEYNISF